MNMVAFTWSGEGVFPLALPQPDTANPEGGVSDDKSGVTFG
jgi:hypothetical protein